MIVRSRSTHTPAICSPRCSCLCCRNGALPRCAATSSAALRCGLPAAACRCGCMNAEEQNALIPETAPFTPAQRAWLNGFFAGFPGDGQGLSGAPAADAPPPAEDFPWHDPAIDMQERLALASGGCLENRLMAAMAQLDCGQCGMSATATPRRWRRGKRPPPAFACRVRRPRSARSRRSWPPRSCRRRMRVQLHRQRRRR